MTFLRCPDCDAELLGQPGERITHDEQYPSAHVWHPAVTLSDDDPTTDHEPTTEE